ncbi:MAG TPA: PBP1A family penicillin-binding protein [Longimicrobiales bacterium]|nr:PBP1A family penicillin-binding protein [Longimicrobiales bacterium]
MTLIRVVRDGIRNGLAGLRARPRLVTALVVGASALAAGALGLGIGTWKSVCRDCPSIAQIYTFEPEKATRILDWRGRLVAELFQERRTPVSIADLPKYVPQAFIAVEDKRFYSHGGFDAIRTTGALLRNILHGRITAGGSTITQQLARNMFHKEIGFRQRYTRKVKELKVAFELENVYSKDQILEAYLNQINFDHGWYGIETAAERYFGKSAAQLDPAEAALLAALPKAPRRYSPFTNPERARARRNLVLGLMNEQGYISDADLQRWQAAPLPDHSHGGEEGDLAPYFVEWVRDILDERFGNDLYRRGYRIYTTLDLDMQRRANVAMDSGWARVERMPGYRHPHYADVMAKGGSPDGGKTPYLQGAFIALDPVTGAVRAMVGGRDFKDSKFNRATQALRQPGSSFKPILYTAAISSGIPASHVIDDAPLMLEMDNGTVYSPGNSDGLFHGPMTLREALKKSVNVVAVKLGQEVGMQTVIQYARRLGITTPIPPWPSTAIGAAEVIPLQLAGAYTALATPGVLARPYPIEKVEDADGRLLWESHPERKAVLDSLPVYIVRDLMRGVLDHGTGWPARDPARGNLPYSIPGAGKTGTTNDYADAWFVGFTPNLLAAVWFGFDNRVTIVPRAEGGVLAAPVWGNFMRGVYFDSVPSLPKPAEWEMPAGIVTAQVDREGGRLATPLCPPELVYTEIFVKGTEPTEACDGRAGGLFGGGLRGVSLDSLAADTANGKPKVNPKMKF